jgi:hypothetical protein
LFQGELEAPGFFSGQGDVLYGKARGFITGQRWRALFDGGIVGPRVDGGLHLTPVLLLPLLLAQELFLLLPRRLIRRARRQRLRGQYGGYKKRQGKDDRTTYIHEYMGH